MKKLLLAAVLALGVSSTSCLGPDHMYNKVKNWNAELSDVDAVNEIVFLGLHIIPVYGISLWIDILILNTINYWSGENPVSAPGPFPGFTRAD